METLPSLYDLPHLYDRAVPPGPCSRFYGRLAAETRGPVLELACGTGRLTVPLALAGTEVTGLDISSAMLDVACRKAQAVGARVRWVQGDVTALDLPDRFDLIMITGNSLAHMTTPEMLHACLTGVRRHLLPGGQFAFDVMNPDRRILSRPPADRLRRGHSAAGFRVYERATFDPLTRVREVRWRVRQADGPEVELEPLRLRIFFADELPDLLASSGLRLDLRFGDFDGASFGARSRNQICVARAADPVG